MLVSSLSYRLLPIHTGVYLFFDKENKVIYVGKALNLRKRVASYFLSKDLGDKTKILVSQIHKIKTIGVTSEIESFLLEERLIKKYKPRYNIKLLDGKSFPSIKITIQDEYPKVLIVRKHQINGSLYFGPYTSSSSLRTVLKILRRIFPYQSVANHSNKLCLYYYLGLCPCPLVTKDKSYKKTINHIIDFLNGNTKKVIKDLEKEREGFSRKEDFESAGNTQKKIDSIRLATSSFYKPFAYEENPNLRSDMIKKDLNTLRDVLRKSNIKVKNLKRIECYDISNISGKYATGSMVVFTNGEKDSSFYRRFKIKKNYGDKPNDFAMMQEMLRRRLKRKDWPKPSLIIVDGGKGQVSSVKQVLENLRMDIPLIGLAKKEETIITTDLREVVLAKDSKTLHLLIYVNGLSAVF